MEWSQIPPHLAASSTLNVKMNDPNSQLDDTVGRNGRDINIEKALGEVVPLDLRCVNGKGHGAGHCSEKGDREIKHPEKKFSKSSLRLCRQAG